MLIAAGENPRPSPLNRELQILRRGRLRVRDFPNTKQRSCVNQRHFAGKRDSRPRSTTSFSENVVVAETSYRILEDYSFCNRQRAKPSSIKITALIFQVKNSTVKLSRLNGFS